MKKLIIIGCGPAGISAALYAKMAGADITVIGTENTSLDKAEHIGNFYGFEDGVTGGELFKRGIKQAENLGIKIIREEVTGLDFTGEFEVVTANARYSAAAVVIATGKNRNKPKIDGFSKFEGKGISYCAVCDGFFYRNKNIGIIGAGEYALHEYGYLKNVAADVKIFADGEDINPAFGGAVAGKVASFTGGERLSGLILDDGTAYELDGVFIAKGTADASAMAKSVGIAAEKGSITVDENGATNVPGIYAAGDCTGGLAQISKSVYEGMKAGMAAAKYLRKINA